SCKPTPRCARNGWRSDMSQTPEILWQPSQEQIERTRLHDYMRWLARHKGLEVADYHALWEWSVHSLEAFCESIWQYFDVQAAVSYVRVLAGYDMPGAKWFEGSRFSLASKLFRFHAEEPKRPAIIARPALRLPTSLSWCELKRQVSQLAQALRR